MITYLSYLQGMSGDFIAYLIHQNSGYVSIDNPKSTNNRYLFPCPTESLLGWEIKHSTTNLTTEDINKLKKHYNNQSLVLPTHRFRSIFNDELVYIRLYTHNIPIARLSYAMWILKSHCHLEEPSMERIDSIKKIENTSIMEELMYRFSKWKWLAWYHNCYNSEDGLDSRYYIKNYFTRYFYIHGHLDSNFRRGYNYFDINELIYKQNTNQLCSALNINLDKTLLEKYAIENFVLLEKNNVDIYSDKFFDQLHDLVEPELVKTMNLYEQTGKITIPSWI